MALLTIRYNVNANGFHAGDVVQVEDSKYIRARLGLTFDLVDEETSVVEEVPSAEEEAEPIVENDYALSFSFGGDDEV